SFFFFFQAEDGIRDRNVTGVQTCALPIFPRRDSANVAGAIDQHVPQSMQVSSTKNGPGTFSGSRFSALATTSSYHRPGLTRAPRSEERRVGKESRGGGAS